MVNTLPIRSALKFNTIIFIVLAINYILEKKIKDPDVSYTLE